MDCFAGLAKPVPLPCVVDPAVARFEAACKLSANFVRVVQDITNPALANIDGKTLTQSSLARVDPKYVAHVRAMVSAVCCRLVGKEAAGASTPEEAEVWLQSVRFIIARLQGSREECPGRTPDMSGAQADEMRVVLAQIEAACKLMSNCETVVKDITNPGPTGVFSPDPSQPELARLDRKHFQSVEAMVHETCALLLGKKTCAAPEAAECAVWAKAAGFLGNRVQDPDDQSQDCIGREADMTMLAAEHLRGKLARMEAAYKLMSNRPRVAQDIINSSPANIDGKALSQPSLQRVDPAHGATVNDMLTALVSLLLGQGVSGPATFEEALVWKQAAAYLSDRIQENGPADRAPDMSENAAGAMRRALGQIEAFGKLKSNSEVVVSDITNESSTGVLGGPLSQRGLKRVGPFNKAAVDAMVQEVCARLLGNKVSQPATGDTQAWADAAAFLYNRIQASAGECPGRDGDMTGDAADALRTVLKQISNPSQKVDAAREAAQLLMANRYRVVQDIANSGSANIDGKTLSQTGLARVDGKYCVTVDAMVSEVCCRLLGRAGVSQPSTPEELIVWGAAASYLSNRVQGTPEEMQGRSPDMSPGAAAALRAVLDHIVTHSGQSVLSGQEAANLLQANLARVVQDVTNQGPENIDGQPLSQTHLVRVDSKDKASVDEMVGEVCSRLRGNAASKMPSTSEGAKAWAAAGRYLSKRVQGSPEQMSGRKPDMSSGAAIALRAVLEQVATQSEKSVAALEAAQLLKANKERVVQDITNAGPKNIDGKSLSQTGLERASDKTAVDAMISEVCCRLEGKAGSNQPSAAWAVAARYLAKRVQGLPTQMPGRKPDMSSGAATALRTVLAQIERMAAPLEPKYAPLEAAKLLSANREQVVQDITNQGSKGVGGGTLSQTGLARVDEKDRASVDAMIGEVCNRLNGKGATNTKPSAVWSVAAQFLSNRVQGSPDQMPGRKPDMSSAAANALCAVLAQITAVAGPLEAAELLQANREKVVQDITNSERKGVGGGALTQMGLQRLDSKDRAAVDAMVTEVCSRLQGKADTNSNPSPVWAVAARFLSRRIQASAAEMPGRNADMSPGAANALRLVLGQLEANASAFEAAQLLLANRKRVVQDITNPGPKNIDGKSLTQTTLERVNSKDQAAVDAMVSEVCNRLQGKGGTEKPAAVWAAAARFLSKRVQGSSEQMPGREPDMSLGAANALCWVLSQMEKAAAPLEAAQLLSANRVRVVQDITNPGPKNIDGKELTQTELARVDSKDQAAVDAMVTEVCNRLQGKAAGAPSPVWAAAARYLSQRVQGSPNQKPDRKPDMSSATASAMCTVLAQIEEVAAPLEAAQLLAANRERVAQDIANPGPTNIDGKALTQTDLKRVDSKDKAAVDSMITEVCNRLQGKVGTEKPSRVWAAAACYLSKRVQGSPEQMPGRKPDMSPGAVQALCKVLAQIEGMGAGAEAAELLAANRERVVQDIANPGPKNIDGKALTQTELGRVDSKDKAAVDAMVSEVCNRLQGKAGANSNPSPVWVAAARYLSKRVQGSPEQMPGRQPDMSSGAANALRLVLAQTEAAHAILANRERVVQDIANPGQQNIDGKALTQMELNRVDSKDKAAVDAMVREVCNRLQGKAATEKPSLVWAAAARYLSKRVQGSPEQMPGRKPDMSLGAANALCAVLDDIAAPLEAAQLLLANRERVVQDIANPGPKNIDGKDLSQPDLERVSSKDKAAVDAMLSELCNRLQGNASNKKPSPEEAKVWAAAARYFSQRIQGSPGQKPGRNADMSSAAAAALQSALKEFGA